MGYQVIMQPDGRLGVFSSFDDTWTVSDATPEEVREWFALLAAKQARETADRIIGQVTAGDASRAYGQTWTLTFAQAEAKRKRSEKWKARKR